MPEIIPCHAESLARAVDLIRHGGLVAYPTETVYGLGVDPFQSDAMDRLYRVKERNRQQPVILLVRGLSDLDRLVSTISPEAHKLMAAFWPGPLTLVFPALPLPEVLLSESATIALRQSGSEFSQQLVDALRGPLTSTSANRAGQPPARSASEVASALGDDVDLILDGGPSPESRPSTLVDLIPDPPAVLREGPVSRRQINDVLIDT